MEIVALILFLSVILGAVIAPSGAHAEKAREHATTLRLGEAAAA